MRELAARRIALDLMRRQDVRSARGYDLVVVVGGDGTFFAASRIAGSTPILAVNSDPEESLALFSCSDRTTFGATLDRALQGKLPVMRLNRMNLKIGSRPLSYPVTNDVLYTHRNPAAMTRYTLAVGRKRERHQSSGVWVCTAAGSTAGTYSAGGRKMPIRSRAIQYVVREPYRFRTSMRLLKGTTTRPIRITAEVPETAIWVDGRRTSFSVPAGETITLTTPGPPLLVLGYRDSVRRALGR